MGLWNFNQWSLFLCCEIITPPLPTLLKHAPDKGFCQSNDSKFILQSDTAPKLCHENAQTCFHFQISHIYCTSAWLCTRGQRILKLDGCISRNNASWHNLASLLFGGNLSLKETRDPGFGKGNTIFSAVCVWGHVRAPSKLSRAAVSWF